MKTLYRFLAEHKSFIKRMLFDAPVEAKAVYYIYAKLFWENRVKFISYIYKRRLVYRYGIYIGENCKIGKNLTLPHPQGIIIGNETVIGDNCVIYQQVTLGRRSVEEPCEKRGTPIIKDNCILYAGAKVIGKVLVRKNTIVATQAVLMVSTEANSIYAGIPAKKIRERKVL